MFMSTSVMNSYLKILCINGFAKVIFGFYCLNLIFAQAKSQGVGGQLHFQYIGCFKGNGSSEIIDTQLQNALTIDICIEICYNKTVQRKTFAGLSNGNRCVCSDHFGRQVSDNECKAKCTGSDNQYCGGISSVSAPIYSVYTVCQVGHFGPDCDLPCHCKDKFSCDRGSGVCPNGCEEHWNGSSCSRSTVNIKEGYIGCYRDNQTAAMDRENPGKENGGNYKGVNSIDFCIGICSSFNFTYAGMQYGYDCYCGESYSRYGSVNEGVCNFKCPANSNQKCGGNWANSVYYACPTGFYGLNCIHRCSCVNGRCSNSGCLRAGCRPGWTGATCSVRDCGYNNGDCGLHQQCTNIELGFKTLSECRCNDGYLKLGTKCVKIYDHYVGCYKGNLSSISLTVLPSIDQLTIEICIIWCHQLNKTYAMMKAGITCLCESNISELIIQPDDKCNLPCFGNQQQNCGWKDNMNSGYVVYSVTDGTSCSSDDECRRDESCKEINLDFSKIKRCRCKPLDSCTEERNNCSQHIYSSEAVIIIYILAGLLFFSLLFNGLQVKRVIYNKTIKDTTSKEIDIRTIQNDNVQKIEAEFGPAMGHETEAIPSSRKDDRKASVEDCVGLVHLSPNEDLSKHASINMVPKAIQETETYSANSEYSSLEKSERSLQSAVYATLNLNSEYENWK